MRGILEIATAVFFCFVAIERAFAGEFFTAILCVVVISHIAEAAQADKVIDMYKQHIKYLEARNTANNTKISNLSEQIRGSLG